MNDITLHLGDCLEYMKDLPYKSIDAVVTDPPYGINFKYESLEDSSEDYGKWLWSIIELAESKCKPGSPIFIYQAMPNIRKFTDWFPRNWRMFAACKNFVQIRPIAMQYSFDPVIVWWTEGDKYSEGSLSRDWHVGNTSPSAFIGLNYAKGHPCPRPLDQMTHIVNQWVRPGGIVFDPFMGSGTTGVACVQTGRKFIGIEIEPKYFEIAQKRIEQAQLQIRMAL